ncbi:MAG TPA: tRNA uridine-5-carboxymethylaminomethyl(34) synthesis enzyme MnmG [Candidatus Omnitrophota bacterium]|nr:tRNA uridine-5-carboxymethylaminomethyl(34) synthesis enzyme MnmG [Candidatus Omnitrophota bacterium]HQP11274.1 tRNA uridine-5-carboxymethylaminomethyl(34) synthesis enzyme MnmG [Candidatus Omnitrophota bacterium]
MFDREYQCVVVGGGHAGVEAALAASRMGCETLLLTLSFSTIGQMSCNPAVGGVGKGQLVKEIDCLGGEMALAADRTGIQFRRLNASKGQAVRSSRCQSDRKRYREYMQGIVRRQARLTVLEDEACTLLSRGSRITGVKTRQGLMLGAPTVVIAGGTFLNGRIHIGRTIIPGGRIDEPACVSLAASLSDLGFEVLSFKTGTPPRLDGKTIDFSALEVQHSDPSPLPFSFRTPFIPPEQRLLPCYITRTCEKTHDIIRANMHLSPMYSGQIHSTGVRYCPSIEDKLKKFGEKSSHHVFLEPEGLDTDEYYPNGISTGLPAEVQEAFVRSIPGLERVQINRYGYSIEHGVIRATELKGTLETKRIGGLYCAGQVNGTTGYEEAAAQGIIAGINAACAVLGKEPLILGRDESYIGVLIDDLITRGTEEPYRMFTSRVEYRLIIREDNADKRLMQYGQQLGLIPDDVYERMLRKYELIEKEIAHLQTTVVHPGPDIDRVLEENNSSPLRQPTPLSLILRRPEMTYAMIAPFNGNLKGQDFPVIEQVEYEIKYEGFIKRQLKDVEKFRHIENIKIPGDIDYARIPGLSIEIQQKLHSFRPVTLGQAHRISGITPAAISILMIYLKKLLLERARG